MKKGWLSPSIKILAGCLLMLTMSFLGPGQGVCAANPPDNPDVDEKSSQYNGPLCNVSTCNDIKRSRWSGKLSSKGEKTNFSRSEQITIRVDVRPNLKGNPLKLLVIPLNGDEGAEKRDMIEYDLESVYWWWWLPNSFSPGVYQAIVHIGDQFMCRTLFEVEE